MILQMRKKAAWARKNQQGMTRLFAILVIATDRLRAAPQSLLNELLIICNIHGLEHWPTPSCPRKRASRPARTEFRAARRNSRSRGNDGTTVKVGAGWHDINEDERRPTDVERGQRRLDWMRARLHGRPRAERGVRVVSARLPGRTRISSRYRCHLATLQAR